jgi:nicotinate phosphoribosyltransferase
MSQFIFELHPNVTVKLKLHNRSAHKLIDYTLVGRFQRRLEEIRQTGFSPSDLIILSTFKDEIGRRRFTPQFINFLEHNRLPKVEVGVENGELSITTEGPWATATLWETIIMSELNEHYYRNVVFDGGGNLTIIGRERLSEKINRLAGNPGIKFADFGTRRRYSYDWHEYLTYELVKRSPNFVGTSNVYLAHEFNLKPIGTFAHELPMVYAALADANGFDPIKSQRTLLSDWYVAYGNELSIALTDTFTTSSFLVNFGTLEASRYKGVRHDSGDPTDFGERMIQFYNNRYINPHHKTIVFSDSLNVNMMEGLHQHFYGRINTFFGWGTDLTNDMGIRANNFVVKVVEANGVPTVKLSDDPGKLTGPLDKILQYKKQLI